MISSHYGEFAALLVAVFWTITALSFESAANKVGPLSVNIIRLVFGLIFLSTLTLIKRGLLLPTDASYYNWFWLGISGIIGFVLGDLFLFKSYTIVGSWFSMLIMTLAPVIAAIFGWIILNESLDFKSLTGMALTLSGISLTIFNKKGKKDSIRLNKPLKGILFAFFGAVGQGLGIVFSKLGMQDYDPFAATQIRIIVGIFGFALVISLAEDGKMYFQHLKTQKE